MTKQIPRILFIVSMSILLTSCSAIRNNMYNNTLEYVNDIGLTVSFPESNTVLDEDIFKALIANVDTGAILYEHMKPVSEELSDILFLGWYQNVWSRDYLPYINDDGYPYDSTYRVFEYYLNNCKTWETFYYIGKVSLSEEYDSYLVASRESDERLHRWEKTKKEWPELNECPNSIYNRIYIVNVKDFQMVSMTMLWWTWDYDFDPRFTYTTAKGKEFIQRECNIYSDSYNGFSLFNPQTWFLRDPTKGVKFVFDKNGRVVLL